jgi:dipeptidyl-peptidase 4
MFDQIKFDRTGHLTRLSSTPAVVVSSASFALLICIFSLTLPAQEKPAPQPGFSALTVERVSAEPDQDEREQTLRWSPDGTRVAWLQTLRPQPKSIDKTSQMQIWGFPLSAQPESKSARQHPVLLVSAEKITNSLRGTDVPLHLRRDDDGEFNFWLLLDFAWSKNHDSLLLIGRQSISLLNLASGKSRLLVSPTNSSGSGAEKNANDDADKDDDNTSNKDQIDSVSLSPDGLTVTFVRQFSLFAVSTSGGPARLVARSPAKYVYEGQSDWPTRNELHLPRTYWWSPDSLSIAWLESDDRKVSKYTLRASTGEAREIVYPRPGGEIPLVHLFVRRLAGGVAKAIDLGPTRNFYLPRVSWLPDSTHLSVERLDRFQHSLELLICDPVTGKSHVVLSEKDEYWINLSDDLRFLADGKRFLWSSERTGYRHLYLYDTAGKQLTQLTHGDWEVTKINAVDEAHGLVYFTASAKTPLERQLYQIPFAVTGLSTTEPAPVTRLAGTHEILFAPVGESFIDTFSNHTTPPRIDLFSTANPAEPSATSSLDAASNSLVFTQKGQGLTHHDSSPIPAPSQPLSATPAGPASTPGDVSRSLLPVEYFTLPLHMGVEAHVFLIKPSDFDPAKKYPVIVYMAGGPGEQLVRDAWGGATGLWMQSMAQKGYLIFALDNQGTAGRGHYFEEPLHLRLSAQELTDQRDGLLYLGKLPYVDTARLGVCGWGYGGYLAVHALLDRPVAFRAGFAGAPVIDWRTYDAFFPERYLEDSVLHSDGWDASIALENESPRFFKSSMLVAQGTADEFVHIENLLTLQDELLDAGKSADILLFPDRGHTIDDPSARLVLFRRMTEFFLKNL